MKVRRTVISILIAIAILFPASVVFLPITNNVSASITGDTYSGSGAWTITTPTVYTGETLTVYGNITINGGGSLTLSNTHLTIDQPSNYYYTVKWGMTDPDPFLKLTASSSISTTNATSGKPNLMLNCQGHGYLQVDNSTLSNVVVAVTATASIAQPSYVSYSTLEGGLVWNQYGLFYEIAEYLDAGPLTLNHNLIKDSDVGHSTVPDTWSLIGLASHAVVVENTFENITLGTRATEAGSYIRANAQHAVTISRNLFDNTTYGLIHVRGYSTYYANDSHIDDNEVGNLGGPNIATATTGIFVRDTAGSGTTVNGNHFQTIKNGSNGMIVYGHDWVLVANEFDCIDASGLIGVGATTGVFVEYSMDVTVHGTIIDRMIGPGIDNGSAAVGVRGIDSGHIIISHSTISDLSNVPSQGICAGDSPYFTNIGGYEIFANTISNVREASNAIYVTGTTGGVVSWNNISQVGGSSTGIMLHGTHSPMLVHNNSVTGLFYEDNVWPHWQISRGAYSACAANTWNVTFKDNHASGFTWEYPAYDISGEKLGGGYWDHMEATIDVSEDAIIRMINANVTLSHDGRVLQILRDGVPVNMTYYTNGTSRAYIPQVDWVSHWVNVTTTSLSLDTTDDLIVSASSSMQWTANASSGTVVVFTLSGLESGRMYRLYIDGERITTLTASSSGSISFTYSGPWSEHEFMIVATGITGSIGPLVDLILLFFALGVVIAPIAWVVKLSRSKKIPTIRQVINLVIFIIVGLSAVGVGYSLV